MKLERNHRFPDVAEITFEAFKDERGYFKRVYDDDLFAQFGLPVHWTQGNESLSTTAGALRGLHFQRPPHAETKYVRVAQGEILDVFVDLREGSITFGKWGSKILNQQNGIVIPKGFAHGFRVISAPAIVVYQVDSDYRQEYEGGVRWNDPDLKIDWGGEVRLVSEKDNRLPLLKELAGAFGNSDR